MRQLTARIEEWPLHRPFRIATRTIDRFRSVTVSLTQGGIIGRGEGCAIHYLGESPESLLDQIDQVRPAIEQGAGQDDLLDLLEPGGARAGLDAALWDLEAGLGKGAVWQRTGISPRPVKTAYTLTITDTPAQLAQHARDAAAYPILKIKLDGRAPLAMLQAVRGARPDADLIVDANQSLTPNQTETLLENCPDLGVSLLEQPLPRGDDRALAQMQRSVPVFADESCQSIDDLAGLEDRYDGINIKLDKCGGLTAALHLADRARQAGFQLMVGNMLGTSLSLAPAFVLAQRCDFADLDGPLLLAQDRPGGLIFDDAGVQLPETGFWGYGAVDMA